MRRLSRSLLRPVCLFSLSLLALATVGCVKVDQTVTLNKDGSGTLDIRYGMSEQSIAQIEAMETMAENMGEEVEAEDDSPFDFDEAKVRKEFEADKPEGVELVSVASEEKDGWKYMTLKLEFANLAALKGTEFYEDSNLTLTREGDNFVLTQKTGAGDDLAGAGADSGGDDAAMQNAMMKQMSAMFAGLRIANNIVVPTAIVESNATSVEGNKASWVFDIDEDPEALTKIGSADLRVVFSADGVQMDEVQQ